ncbi:arylsulfatase [Pseudomonas aeruginosa]
MKRALFKGVTLSIAALFGCHADAAERPNILLIVADDLGYSDTQPFGGEIPTPSLQQLADQGVRLTNFYAGPTCSLTRSMLMSGVDNHIAGLGTMDRQQQPEQIGKPGYEGYLNRRVASLAELLADKGYHTYIAGKWHLGMKPEQGPAARGFERSFVLLPGGASHFDDAVSMYPADREKSTGIGKAPYLEDGKPATPPRGFYSSAYYTDRMIEYIEAGRKDDKPFFGYLAYTAPHWPLQVPDADLDRFRGRYAEGYEALRQERLKRMRSQGIIAAETAANTKLEGKLPKWEELTDEQRRQQARTMELYAAMVANMDQQIGRLLAYLQSTKQLDNTFILFMSDNGAEASSLDGLRLTDWVNATFDNGLANMGKKNSYLMLGPQWGQVGSTPFPYYKGLTARGGINVPAIVRFPGIGQPGNIETRQMHVLDVVPTALELAGARYPAERQGHALAPLQGRSMLAPLAGKEQPERPLGWEYNGRRNLIKGDWSLLMQAPPFGTGNWELYNLKDDPTALHDLSSSKPEKVKELAADWEKYARDNGVVLSKKNVRYGYITCLFGHCVE